jgi:hypothetical protein
VSAAPSALASYVAALEHLVTMLASGGASTEAVLTAKARCQSAFERAEQELSAEENARLRDRALALVAHAASLVEGSAREVSEELARARKASSLIARREDGAAGDHCDLAG